MKTVSVSDLVLIPELSHFNTFDFIHPDNDEIVGKYLYEMGFDLDYALEYIASQHRNLQGKVVISYLIAGDVRCDRTFLTSQWASVEDKMIAAGYTDLGLAQELAQMMAFGRDYGNVAVAEGFPPDLTNENEEEILMQVKVLADVLLAVRGDPYKSDGSRKTLSEQNLPKQPEKKRAKKSK